MEIYRFEESIQMLNSNLIYYSTSYDDYAKYIYVTYYDVKKNKVVKINYDDYNCPGDIPPNKLDKSLNAIIDTFVHYVKRDSYDYETKIVEFSKSFFLSGDNFGEYFLFDKYIGYYKKDRLYIINFVDDINIYDDDGAKYFKKILRKAKNDVDNLYGLFEIGKNNYIDVFGINPTAQNIDDIINNNKQLDGVILTYKPGMIIAEKIIQKTEPSIPVPEKSTDKKTSFYKNFLSFMYKNN